MRTIGFSKLRRRGTASSEIRAKAPVPRIRQILVTTDFSNESQIGVRYAHALAAELKAGLTLMHVVELPSTIAGENLLPTLESRQVMARVGADLDKVRNSLGKSRVPIILCVRKGWPFLEIIRAAGDCAADMIVLATHGHTGVKRAVLGSTAERVVRHASCPVLTVPARAASKRSDQRVQFKIGRILVPIDFSSTSEDALPWAVALAQQFCSTLALLHVTEKSATNYLLGPELMNEMLTTRMRQAEADLAVIAGRLTTAARVNTSAAVRYGLPYEEICDAAKSLFEDMVVLTTHGCTGLKAVWLGSTAERVVRYASCPVLVVRPASAAAL